MKKPDADNAVANVNDLRAEMNALLTPQKAPKTSGIGPPVRNILGTFVKGMSIPDGSSSDVWDYYIIVGRTFMRCGCEIMFTVPISMRQAKIGGCMEVCTECAIGILKKHFPQFITSKEMLPNQVNYNRDIEPPWDVVPFLIRRIKKR
eukprot:3578771-Ditylum_brightwellii.AAC.1